VSLVDDHRVPAFGQVADLVQDERELLQRGDDDPGLFPGQGLGELPGVLVDPRDHAAGVLELVDRVLQLAVQHQPVGDHDHLVEHLRVRRVAQRGQPVCGPRDRVRLPRPSRVLDQVTVARSVLPGMCLDRQHRVPLMEPREDHHLGREPRRRRPRRGPLHMDEPCQDVQPRVPRPRPLPQVRGAVTGRVRRVTRPTVMTEVERQEPGRLPGKPGRHRHPVWIHREMHQRTLVGSRSGQRRCFRTRERPSGLLSVTLWPLS
jgi:hypothetical protein